MPSLAIVKAANASFNPSYTPIIVITGATSGIGEAITRLFASLQKGRAQIYLVGRNRAAANSIIASLPQPPPEVSKHNSSQTPAQGYTYEFIQCDVSLMKNVHDLARDLSSRLPHLNFLVHSAGVIGLSRREETSEGIDLKLASRYYARWTLTNDLLPLLRKAKDLGQVASVVSVLGAGVGLEKVDVDDLGMKTNYGWLRAMLETASYNDLMVAEFAKREPTIAFTHMYPGGVDTAMVIPSNPILKVLIRAIHPILRFFLISSADCAEYVVYALLVGEKGMHRRDSHADDIGLKKFPAADGMTAEELQKRLWDHTVQETSVS
ncbi:hypothetical protein NLJ89_g8057 [Agrocybe chaxingu]|uniref:Ketoreductase (KR) domain-containing protein n=1 Tax=Agrocybe chaxingu TaxID=84603 RepID=A0A9W8JTC3_9AGAR|nr:hypothetical protein NLJ89_g8057 [Agrocybe chaxingu]